MIPPAGTIAHPELEQTLAQQTIAVIEEVRTALRELLSFQPLPMSGATELARALDINTVIAWNVYRVISSPDALSAGMYVPTQGRLRSFLQAVRDKGASAEAIERTVQAFAEFENLVKTHAPDRDAFNSLILDIQGVDSPSDILKHKRAAYRANRHLCGIHSELGLDLLFIHPSATAEQMDFCQINGDVRMQRNRSNSTLLQHRTFELHSGWSGEHSVRGLLDNGDLDHSGLSILRRFCSQPLPDIHSELTPTDDPEFHRVSTEVHTRSLGSAGAVTYFFGYVMRGLDMRHPIRKTLMTRFHFGVQMTVPTEVYIHDFWVHKDILPGTTPNVQIKLLSDATERNSTNASTPTDPLPFSESIKEIGYGLKDAAIAEFPRYQELSSYVAERLSWRIEDFRLFRCRIEYPMLCSVVMMTFPHPRPLTTP